MMPAFTLPLIHGRTRDTYPRPLPEERDRITALWDEERRVQEEAMEAAREHAEVPRAVLTLAELS